MEAINFSSTLFLSYLITKIPLGTIKSRIRLAMEKIRDRIEKDKKLTDPKIKSLGIN